MKAGRLEPSGRTETRQAGYVVGERPTPPRVRIETSHQKDQRRMFSRKQGTVRLHNLQAKREILIILLAAGVGEKYTRET